VALAFAVNTLQPIKSIDTMSLKLLSSIVLLVNGQAWADIVSCAATCAVYVATYASPSSFASRVSHPAWCERPLQLRRSKGPKRLRRLRSSRGKKLLDSTRLRQHQYATITLHPSIAIRLSNRIPKLRIHQLMPSIRLRCILLSSPMLGWPCDCPLTPSRSCK
jgi:hypothetical protein